MEYTERIALWLTDKIAKKGGYSETELEKIKYGIHLNLMGLNKGAVIFILSYLLGIFRITLIGFIAFSLFRTYSFGMHAKKSIFCLSSSILTFVGTAYLIHFFKLETSYVQVGISYMIILLSVMIYAPADTEERPILPKYRDQMKKRAIRNTLIAFTISLLLVYLDMKMYATSFCVMGLIESMMINPITYMIFRQRYNNYIYYLKGEY